jgi:signal transduction histidine kinase
MGELARRHDLETELPLVRQEIQRRYSRQKKWQAALAWTAGAAVAAGVLGILVVQLLRMRQIAQMRERFAADLHDELGANLHSIGLLAEMARDDANSHGKLGTILEEIQRMVASTGAAAKYCIEKQIHPFRHDLPAEMRKTNQRILADMEWELDFRGEEHLEGLKPAFLDDLLLFYKECLVNISRHSKATRVRASLEADPKRIQLMVADNGQGFSGGAPPSLQRRARLLGGRLSARPVENSGTTISLTLRAKRR